jgi:hypothetical protein
MDAPREPQDWQFALYLSGSALKATSRDSSVDSIGPRRTSSIVDIAPPRSCKPNRDASHSSGGKPGTYYVDMVVQAAALAATPDLAKAKSRDSRTRRKAP